MDIDASWELWLLITCLLLIITCAVALVVEAWERRAVSRRRHFRHFMRDVKGDGDGGKRNNKR